MYYDYFGLKQPPFKITPDTSLFYPGCNRGAVLEALIYAILNGEGIVKVVGEVGSGKTMLCRMLERELPDNIEIVYLANPSLSPENILHAIAFELKLPVEVNSSRLQVMNKLHEYLLQGHSRNQQVVVFVEEAQGMPIATLEEIRLLSNLETQQNKLLQIVLFGQPELDSMIARPEIRQLKERITYSFELKPFGINDIREYLNARLRACGHRAGELFDGKAIKEIERFSKGLVRRINILADKALLAAYAENSHMVNKGHVRIAARDSEFISKTRFGKGAPILLASALVVTVILGFFVVTKINPPLSVPASNPVADIAVNEAKEQKAVPEEIVTAGVTVDVNSDSDKEKKPAEAEAVLKQEEMAHTAEAETPVMGPDELTDDAMTVVPGIIAGEQKLQETTASLEDQARVELKELIDPADPRISTNLTESELNLLQRQLEVLPPEVALLHKSSPSGDICRVCWSVIYRPLQNPENL